MSDYVLSLEQGAKNGLTLDEDGKYRYYIDGEFQSGVITVDGYKYISKAANGAAATSTDYQDENSYRCGSCYYQLTEDGKIINKELI